MQTKYDDIFNEASAKYGVDVDLLKAVAKTESNFDTNAVSSAGAVGVMQLMPATAESLGVTNRSDAYQNIMGGAKYLASLLDQTDGDVETALAGYNAGMGNVKKYGKEKYSGYYKKVLSYYDGDKDNFATVGVSGGTPTGTADTKWWGDIVIVVICILLILTAVLFFIQSFASSVPTIKNKVKKSKKGR